ncbi:TetR/AcrR family transcriptional regulator [Vallitalea guaymasensis]|uniref:TetR/AcrR family transcriptional regulator n=1 Tax=Vallitalea guaymasensis TaxID=1185412 RepID=UPI000DE2D4D7|nr:TetR/AcrR family transcriptional regulator [Vallitalea guaymasensis]
MQIKKDEVKNAIIKSGEKEFLEKGYEKASIRKIVKQAGTTIGNFYNYFDNKEALFEVLVKDEYDKFIYFIHNHDKIERPDYLWQISNPSKWRVVLSELLSKVVPNFGIGLIILLDCSEGTKFANCKNELVNLIKNHFIEHIEKYNKEYNSIEIGDIISEQLIDGIIKILRNNNNPDLKHKLITEYILFYMIGTMGLIGDFNF